MASNGEFKAVYPTAKTLYGVVTNTIREIYRVDLNAFEAIDSTEWANYAIPLTEQDGTGIYLGDFPFAWKGFGKYFLMVYVQQGEAPVYTDRFLGSKERFCIHGNQFPPEANWYIDSGQVQGATSITVTLERRNKPAAWWIGLQVHVDQGSGPQVRTITDFDATTSVANLDRNWASIPSAGDTYSIQLPNNALNMSILEEVQALQSVSVTVSGQTSTAVGFALYRGTDYSQALNNYISLAITGLAYDLSQAQSMSILNPRDLAAIEGFTVIYLSTSDDIQYLAVEISGSVTANWMPDLSRAYWLHVVMADGTIVPPVAGTFAVY